MGKAETLTLNAYQDLAMATRNTALTPDEVLKNAVLGLCGEAGECADIVKKHFHQGHELDTLHLLEEVGDVMWYCAELCLAIGFRMGDAGALNIQKLTDRYHGSFSAEKSIHREV